MTRWHGWITWTLLAGLTTSVGCSPDSETRDRAAGEPTGNANATAAATGATNEAPTMLEMLDALPPLPTHWIADPPIAADVPPVDDAMLRDPFADRSRWLHYAGDHRGHRHSPITSRA